jgi:hypothetical protein
MIAPPCLPPVFMDPFAPDPHSHVPSPSADAEWADATGVEDLASHQAPRRPVFFNRRLSHPRESARPPGRTKAEMGLQIDVNLPARRPVSEELPPAATDGDDDEVVIKLDAGSGETYFPTRQTIAPLLKPPPAPLSQVRGEGSEWGRNPKVSTRWLAAAAGGVLLLVVAALLIQESWLRVNKPVSLPVIDQVVEDSLPEVVGFELDSSSETEARALLDAYARATTVEEVVPLIRHGQNLVTRLHQDWVPWQPQPHWRAPATATWSVNDEGGRSHGVLKGAKPDFTRFRAYFVREDAGLKLDWEATQGIGDASFETLRKGLGSGGKVRVYAKLNYFHTEHFPEESYHSFRLGAPDGEQHIWGYSKLGTAADTRLMAIFEPGLLREPEKSEYSLTVRLEPGPEGCQKNQWIIGEMLHIEWVSP